MTLELSDATENASRRTVKNPQIVLEIDGIDTRFGSDQILELIRIGDPGLLIDGTWVVGGYREVEDQEAYISLDGTTTSINQQLRPDKGQGTSITSLKISLLDINNEVTNLISPGQVVADVAGRKARVYLGFKGGTSYPEDYLLIFRGIISEINAPPGVIDLVISHPEQKKRVSIYESFETTLVGDIDDSTTTIVLDSVSNVFTLITGPDGSYDSAFKSYIRVEDEVILFTGLSGNTLTGVIRGQLGTANVAHDDEEDVATIYRLNDNSMTLALKIMLSGLDDYYQTGVEATNFELVPPATEPANTIYFDNLDVSERYGVIEGDYITTTGASNGANNVTLKQITDVTKTDTGSYLTIDGVTFTKEVDTAATISFRSQYDTLPDGCLMHPDEVDVFRHEELRDFFLPSSDLDFFVADTIDDAKQWLEEEIYLPTGGFSVPRKAKSSAGYHIGPIPGSKTTILTENNIVNPDKLVLKRSITRNFFNTIIYKFDFDVLENKPRRNYVNIDNDSFNRIPIGKKALIIPAHGMREADGAQTLAATVSNRKLERYKFGAEHINKMQVFFGDGFVIEVGDILILDPTNLKIANTADGNREKESKLFEVVNKSMDFKTGSITIDIVDTAYTLDARYALIGLASDIKTGISTSSFIIKETGDSAYGENEFRKWEDFEDVSVVVHSPDSVTRYDTSEVGSFTSNTITLKTALSFTPQADDIMEFDVYTNAIENIKLLYGFMSDSDFGDGGKQYLML